MSYSRLAAVSSVVPDDSLCTCLKTRVKPETKPLPQGYGYKLNNGSGSCILLTSDGPDWYQCRPAMVRKGEYSQQVGDYRYVLRSAKSLQSSELEITSSYCKNNCWINT